MRKTLLLPVLATGVLSAVAAAAGAAQYTALPAVLKTLSAPSASSRSCVADQASSLAGVARTDYVAPMSGYVTVRGSAPDSSDWALAVFDAATGRRIGASQGFGSHEGVQTWVTAGQRLAIQGCREAGDAGAFDVATTLVDAPLPSYEGKSQLIEVTFSSQDDLNRLDEAGLDVTHDIHGDKAVVRVTGAKQLAALDALGLPTKVKDADLDATNAAARAADADAGAAGPSPLPSGRTSYRTYEDYQAEMKGLV